MTENVQRGTHHARKHPRHYRAQRASPPRRNHRQAMQRSPIKDIEIKHFLKNALTHDLSRQTFMKGIDTSYYYEYRTQDL